MSVESYDTIILGAGSAGCVLAARLSEDPGSRVLLLEAGGDDKGAFFQKPGLVAAIYQIPPIKAKCDWGYHTVPQPGLDGRALPYTRGRILGGCSTINGMLYIRGHRQNYDDWAVDNPGWSFDEVLPLFRRSESHEDGPSEYHGGEGPMKVSRLKHIDPVSRAFVEALSRRAGVPMLDDLNGAEQECASFYHQTAADRRRSSTSNAFLRPNLDRANFTLKSGAMVRRILIEGGRAIGVEYEQEGEVKRAHADAEVISCLGTVGSPQILMLSGIGPAEHLGQHGLDVVADLPVGENLHDHLYLPMRYFSKNVTHRSNTRHFLGGVLNEYLFGRGWLGETFIHGGGFVKSRPEERLPDVQYFCTPWAYPEPNDDIPGANTPDTRKSFTLLPTLIYPKSRGTVRLASGDPADAPLIDPAFLTHPADAATLLRALRLTREVAATEPLVGQLQAEAAPGADRQSDEELAAEIRLRAHTVYHPVGTCKMAPGSDGVVDHELRVKGVEGLRVADASIMPTITGGNTNAPAIMIGEKCADLVRGR